jgi:hypothetical protein
MRKTQWTCKLKQKSCILTHEDVYFCRIHTNVMIMFKLKHTDDLNVPINSSICLSVCLHVTTEERPNGFSWNLIRVRSSTKICQHIPNLVKIDNGNFTWRLHAFLHKHVTVTSPQVTRVTWGISNQPDNSDVTGAVHMAKGQILNMALYVHFLTCYLFTKILSVNTEVITLVNS